MTDRQKLFAEEYVKDRDPQRAYRTAYPRIKSDATAAANASRLLNDAKFEPVQAYIAELLRRASDDAVADAHEVLAYLTSVLRGESEAEVVVIEGQGVGVSEARRMTKAPDEREKLKAAELLAKYHQLLVPKVQIEAEKGGGVIVLAEATDGEP